MSGDSSSYDALWEASWGEAARVGPGFRSRYELLLGLMERVGVRGRLLDVGAGRGNLLARVHDRFPWLQLSAQEPAPGARERLRELEFLDAVLDDLGDAGEAGYDAVVCSEVLEHVDDDEAALDGLVAALAPGGRLFLTVPLRASLWTKVDDAVGHRRRYEPGALAAMCGRRGLLVEVDRAVGFPLYNTYYRLLGRRPPRGAGRSASGPLGRAAAGLLCRLFVAEARLDTPWGGRGVVVARRPQEEA